MRVLVAVLIVVTASAPVRNVSMTLEHLMS